MDLLLSIAKALNIASTSIIKVEEWAYVYWVKFTHGRPRFISKKIMTTKDLNTIILSHLGWDEYDRLCVGETVVDGGNYDENGFFLQDGRYLEEAIQQEITNGQSPLVELTADEISAITLKTKNTNQEIDLYNQSIPDPATYKVEYWDVVDYMTPGSHVEMVWVDNKTGERIPVMSPKELIDLNRQLYLAAFEKTSKARYSHWKAVWVQENLDCLLEAGELPTLV